MAGGFDGRLRIRHFFAAFGRRPSGAAACRISRASKVLPLLDLTCGVARLVLYKPPPLCAGLPRLTFKPGRRL